MPGTEQINKGNKMNAKPSGILSDDAFFELLKKAEEQFQAYIKIQSFNNQAFFSGLEEPVFYRTNNWENPLDLYIFREKKDAFLE